jgi:ATPase subunit of ABC transporter with duplicated ATPase domains
MLFTGDESEKRLSALSGGEAARLIYARRMIEKPNDLVLDEPTNHLDLEAIEALVESLLAYDGTLVFVSQERLFVNELATRIIEITPDGLHDFNGSYDEYLERAGGEDHLDAEQVLRRAKQQKSAKRGKAQAGGASSR